MSPNFRRRFRRRRDGSVVVSLPEEEREALAEFLRQMRELLVDDTDPSLRRLKPPARPDDAESESEYRGLVDHDLLQTRLDAIDLVAGGLDGATLDSEGVGAWMQALNCLRLILGERFDAEGIEPDIDNRDSPLVGVYHWLAWLLEQLVDAATPNLDG